MPGENDPSARTLKKVEEKEADKRQKKGFARVLAPFMEVFGLSHTAAIVSFSGLCLLCLLAVYWFFRLAPPHVLRVTAGEPGSAFHIFAEKYRDILSSNGVQLIILQSQGSLDNLTRLYDTNVDVDIGFVQGGISNAPKHGKIVSLGSVSYEPVMIFYRGKTNISFLSELKNKRVVAGPSGSGTRAVSVALLEMNGITNGGPTELLDFEAADAAKALVDGKVDAIFLTGDSAAGPLMRQLLLNPDIRLYDFTQADAYTRRVGYLNKLELPRGSLDFGRNIPNQDVYIVGPTVELLARRKLHPALCDLLLEAARDVHGGSGLLRRKGEFPAPLEHEFPLSSEALRYYKSGKSFLYRYCPFWIASMLNRILLVFVPLFVVLLPALKFLPSLLQWRTKLMLYRWYRALLLIEKDVRGQLTAERRQEVLARLDEVEHAVNRMKVPASFADQFYGLRGDIEFVRQRLANHVQEQQ